jgi:hypothetical protein
LYTGGERKEVESRELKLERKEENAERQSAEPVVGESAMESEKKKEGQPEMAVPQESLGVMRLG